MKQQNIEQIEDRPIAQIIKATVEDTEELNILINSAYRGETSRLGWTTEADYLDGQRIDTYRLKEELSAHSISIFKAILNKELVGCVKLEKKLNYFYLGMLTCKPNKQNQSIGKQLLSYCENFAKENNVFKIKMNVISIRKELINWYLSKGYQQTEEIENFPYGDERFGIPKREDLKFIILEKNL